MRSITSRAACLGAATLAAAALSLAAVHPVSAHDVKTIGPLTVALGWVHEPAYVGVDNAVQFIVKKGEQPVTDITDKDVKVTVSLGSQKMDAMPLVPTADPDTGLGLPGEYEMHFIPTAPGNYTFHVTGTIDGTPIDDNVTASDKTFATVDNPTDVEFPTKVPTATDLSTKVDRLAARVSALEGRSIPPDAMPLAVVALVVAVLLGGGALLVSRRGRSSEI